MNLTLQDGIERAGSPIKLLWKSSPQLHSVPEVPAEFSGWKEEQMAWQDGVVLFDLCHHMPTLYIEGPDARKVMNRVFANDMENHAIGQAKQAIALNAQGRLINDGILMREAEDRYQLNAVPPLNNWLMYHGRNDDVEFRFIGPTGYRPADVPPPAFRYQIQGPKAMQVIERLLGGPAPDVRFFHSAEVTIAGRTVRAFRHGMTGLPGFEFIGRWEDNDAVLAAILEAGEPFGLVRVGGLAYYTNGLEGGWIPFAVPGIFSDPDLEDYRRSIPLFSFEGQRALHGSFFSENIEDYYVWPHDYGYAKLLNSKHDFIGREAVLAVDLAQTRKRVTLVFDRKDVDHVYGPDLDYLRRDAQDRIEVDGKMVGLSLYTVNMAPHGTVMSLGTIDQAYAQPGTQVEVVVGDHPGPGTPPEAHRDLPRIRATVEASPYSNFARTQYRR